MADTFDFSNLRRDPPKGFSVVEANSSGLVLLHDRTDRYFRITKSLGEFKLEQRSDAISREYSFVMRTDDLGRLMRLLGYNISPTLGN